MKRIFQWLAASALFLGAYFVLDVAWCRFCETWAIENQAVSVWWFELWLFMVALGIGVLVLSSCLIGKLLYENGK